MIRRFHSLTDSAPSAIAAIDGGTGAATSREALLREALSLAAEMRARGLAAGDAVAVQLPNSTHFLAATLALFDLGAVVVPIDRDAREQEVAAVLGHFGIRGLVYTPERARVAISTRDVAAGPALPPGSRLVKLTSGSTGMPKGIVVTEENLEADCRSICSSMEIDAGDVNLGAIPMSHSYGFSNLVTPLILQGTAVVVTNDYLPQSLLELANRHRCTVAPLIPMVFDHLAAAARGCFESVRTFVSAGAPLPAATSRRFRERFGLDIHSFYGCSECGGITYDRTGAAVERGTVGSALHGVELSIEGGRLTVRGPAVASGILFDARRFEPLPDQTFTTDDLVETRAGEIVLTGRAGDLINTAGKKVNPREVETVILEIAGVREVKVFGQPAGARGEVVAAAVVGDPDLTRERVRRHCMERLSAHKVPRVVKLLESIPVDERGKVKRAALAAL